ncbi:MAG: glycosyltransferase [Saprospiraceae bacterium]|nr:glycosyltransferase [Saprospiraceae bacterium]
MKILVIAPRFPWPLEKGDKLRLYQQIRYLAIHHDVTVFTLTHSKVSPSDEAELKKICPSYIIHQLPFWKLPFNLVWGLVKGLPLSVSYFTNWNAVQAFWKIHKEIKPDLVYGQLARIGEYLKAVEGVKVIDVMDAFASIALQKAKLSSLIVKPLYLFEAWLLGRYEQTIPGFTSQQIFISERDRQLVDPGHNWPAIIVPNGIDLDYFTPTSEKQPSYDVLFVGNLGYFPNVQAVKLLIKEIMPLVWKKFPNAKVLIAGARPSAGILAFENEKITIQGWLPDIREAYTLAKIFVAPLFQGAGMQNKILEAMAMKLPVVTSRHVNKAISATENVEVLIGNSPFEVADQILKLLQDQDFRDQIALAGHIFVHNNYSWSESVDLLLENGFKPTLYNDE